MDDENLKAQRLPLARRLLRWVWRGLMGIVAVYGLFVLFGITVWLIFGERWTPVSMFVAYLTIMLMSSIVFLPLTLLARRWKTAVLFVPPLVIFVALYLPVFVPRIPSFLPEGLGLRLMTYNLHAEREVMEPMIETIRMANADVVALQEMSREIVPLLNTELADLYPYRELYPEATGNPYHGRGLLSRYPITEVKNWEPVYPIPLRLQRVVLDMNDQPITVYNFHAPPSFPIYGEEFDARPRGEQVEDLLEMIRQDSGAVLLMCDCNTYDLDRNYRLITSALHDAYREVGMGMGYTNPDWSTEEGREGPAFIPMHQRPDYIFYNNFFEALEAHVWPTSGGSDHRPVYVVMGMKK